MKAQVLVFSLVPLLAAVMTTGQGATVDRELEEAKALYREAKFAQAIGKLHAVIGRLEQLRDLQARKIQLSDAHLHLALSYVALNDPTAAKESLKQMLRADRNRRLDPDVYAPKVIELFEEARAEVAKEPPLAAAVPVPASSPQAVVAKKGGSKAPLIVLVVGAAAGGVALAGKGGSSSTVATPAATPTATPAPPPAVSSGEGISLIGSSHPGGSTLSVSRRDVLTLMFSVIVDRDERDVFVRLNFSEGQGGPCIPNPATDSAPFSLTRGQAGTTTVSVPVSAWQEQLDTRCTLPVSVRPVVYVQGGTCSTRPSGACIRKDDTTSWTFVR